MALLHALECIGVECEGSPARDPKNSGNAHAFFSFYHIFLLKYHIFDKSKPVLECLFSPPSSFSIFFPYFAPFSLHSFFSFLKSILCLITFLFFPHKIITAFFIFVVL